MRKRVQLTVMEALFNRHAVCGAISFQFFARMLRVVSWTWHVLVVLDVSIVWHLLHVTSTESERVARVFLFENLEGTFRWAVCY